MTGEQRIGDRQKRLAGAFTSLVDKADEIALLLRDRASTARRSSEIMRLADHVNEFCRRVEALGARQDPGRAAGASCGLQHAPERTSDSDGLSRTRSCPDPGCERSGLLLALKESPVVRREGHSFFGTPCFAVFPPNGAHRPQTDRRAVRPAEPRAPLAPVTLLGGDATISIDDFGKIDLRIARIVNAEHVNGADKLLKLTLDIGEKRDDGSSRHRTVFAGIKSAYKPEDLVGRLTPMVANLAPRKMKFGISEGMVLAASGEARHLFARARFGRTSRACASNERGHVRGLSPIIPANAGIQGRSDLSHWVPACAGTTTAGDRPAHAHRRRRSQPGWRSARWASSGRAISPTSAACSSASAPPSAWRSPQPRSFAMPLPPLSDGPRRWASPDLPFHLRLDALSAFFLFLLGAAAAGHLGILRRVFPRERGRRAGPALPPVPQLPRRDGRGPARERCVPVHGRLGDDGALLLFPGHHRPPTARDQARWFPLPGDRPRRARSPSCSASASCRPAATTRLDAMRSTVLTGAWPSIAFLLALAGFGAKAASCPCTSGSRRRILRRPRPSPRS